MNVLVFRKWFPVVVKGAGEEPALSFDKSFPWSFLLANLSYLSPDRWLFCAFFSHIVFAGVQSPLMV
jgi:hypothetical protein